MDGERCMFVHELGFGRIELKSGHLRQLVRTDWKLSVGNALPYSGQRTVHAI
jgi:hypothetical protein